MLQRDLDARVGEVIAAWGKMRPDKSFFGLTLDGFKFIGPRAASLCVIVAGGCTPCADQISEEFWASGRLW